MTQQTHCEKGSKTKWYWFESIEYFLHFDFADRDFCAIYCDFCCAVGGINLETYFAKLHDAIPISDVTLTK